MIVPVFFIKKKDGFLQLVQDYWALNTMMVKNKYSLSLISKLILQLCGTRYFTKLDAQRWVEGSLLDKPGSLWTSSNVLQYDQ